MESIKRSGYASFKYRNVLNGDPAFQSTIIHEEKINKNFSDQCHDIFQGLFQKEIKYNNPCDPAIQNMFDAIKDTPDFKTLKERTTNKAISSFIGMQDMIPSLRSTMKELNEKGNKPLTQKEKDELRQKMRCLIREATEKVEETEEALSVAGIGKEGGINSQQDIGDALTVAKQIASNPTFKNIIEMAGRLMNDCENSIKTDCDKGQEVLVGVTMSDNILEMIPSERIKDDDLIVLNWFDGKLFTNKYKGKNPKSKGAKIACIDRSGSMYGFPYEFSNAILFAIYLVAKENDQKFYVNLFSSTVQSFEIKELKDILQVMRNFDQGGTDFNCALMRSFEQIESEVDLNTADIIFVTDGLDTLSQETENKIKEIKSKISLKILSLMIGYHDDCLRKFSDKVFKCRDESSSEEFCKEVFSL